MILVNLIALLIFLYYGYALFQNIFQKGLIFFQQLSRRNKVELKFDDNIHRLSSFRSGKKDNVIIYFT